MNKVLFLMLLFSTLVYAKTPFTLTGIKELYPVVEVQTEYVPQQYAQIISQKVKTHMDALGVNTKNFSDRSIAILISGFSVEGEPVLHVKLLIGDEVKRSDGEEVFAMIYANEDIFEVIKLEDQLPQAIENLLEQFDEQYEEDNE
jgi:hypothetical protein